MQQKTYASSLFASQIQTDSYAGHNNTSSGAQNRAFIAAIRTLSNLNTSFIRLQCWLYQDSVWTLSEHYTGFIRM